MTLVKYYISNAFRSVCRMRLACVAAIVFMSVLPVCRAVAGAWPAGEDGSSLWLRMGPAVGDAKIDTKDRSAVAKTAVRELVAFWKGGGVSLVKDNSLPDNDGFMIAFPDGDGKTVIRARRSVGLLYGAYELLRRQQMRSLPSTSASKSFVSMPALADRVMCHYDGVCVKSVGGHVGESLLQWNEIDGRMGTMGIDQRERLITYARANASVCINGCVVDTTGAGLCVLGLLFVAPLVKMFVKLSHHCQRGTGNTTFNLAADTGLVAGMALALWAGKDILTCGWLSGVWLLALLVAGLVAYPYYKKKRVR